MSAARILLLDLETAPILCATWRLWDTNAVYVVRNSYILMCQYQWLGEKKVHTRAVCDYHGYKKDPHNDKNVCLHLRELLSKADCVVAHNGDTFDFPMVLGRLFAHGIAPPSPFKQIDTKKIANGLRLDSRALDALGKITGVGRKVKHEGAAMWEAIVERQCPRAWAKMRRYGIQDIRLLARVYPLLRPFAKNHPDLTVWSERPGCPVCQSTHVKKDGFSVLRKRRVQQWQCLADGCGKYFSNAGQGLSGPQRARLMKSRAG